MEKRWRLVGIDFDHMHMGDLLRMAHAHPRINIVGVADRDPARAAKVAGPFDIGADQIWTDPVTCLRETGADIAVLCPSTGRHADVVRQVAPWVRGVLVEKPFAANVADADAMVRAVKDAGGTLAINWPLAWYPSHRTAKRLIDEGAIGAPLEVHYHDGNRGPLRHVADKVEIPEEEAAALRADSWWYRKDAAGGSLQDYLGYGTTLGTWFLDGRTPVEVTCVVDERPGMEVDEHAIVVARYENPVALSKFETRWGTFTDPWTHQPEPRCGFVIVGSRGTIASPDYAPSIRVQTVDHPEGIDIEVDTFPLEQADPIAHFVHHLETGAPLHGPLRPDLCRIGQLVVDAAVRSARAKRTVAVVESGPESASGSLSPGV